MWPQASAQPQDIAQWGDPRGSKDSGCLSQDEMGVGFTARGRVRVIRGAGAVMRWGQGPCLGLELGGGGCRHSMWSCLALPHPTVRQYADICLFSTAQYKCPVAQIEQE